MLKNILKHFNTLDLQQIEAVKLLDRVETKVVFPRSKLLSVLNQMESSYDMLCIDGLSEFEYESQYFDTPEFRMYLNHQNQRSERYKVRRRKYVDSGIEFFEVKKKTNKRTIKNRILNRSTQCSINPIENDFLQKHSPYSSKMLIPQLKSKFKRITFVDKLKNERLTIDFDLAFMQNGITITIPWMVIAEIKQDLFTIRSPFLTTIKSMGYHPVSISKYCLGTSLLNSNLKSNGIKEKIHLVQKNCEVTMIDVAAV